MSKKTGVENRKTNSHLPGISREAEEAYLADMIQVTQKNLDKVRDSVKKLDAEMSDLRAEIDQSGEKDSLILLHTATAQYDETVRDISRREKARKKPYFGRIDFRDGKTNLEEAYYIGRVGVSRSPSEPVVIDWRTPVASLYYENNMGKGTYTVSSEGTFEVDLKRKRNYEIAEDKLIDFYDLDVVANDDLLTKYLSKNKTEVLGEIIATIQKEQNQIIRRNPKTNVIVQGVAGSGKTTVAMHRISYILFNYADDFRPEDFYVIGSNEILLNYITSVLPELDVYGVRQMTMEQLFVRLLYEDWDRTKYKTHVIDKRDTQNAVKGQKQWFLDLQAFCDRYEEAHIPADDVYLEKTGDLLLNGKRILEFVKERPRVSMQSKLLMLNDLLYGKYENVILSRHISFTPEEKKALERTYKNYYARNEWKGSIYDLYMDFLEYQEYEEGYDLDYSKMTGDAVGAVSVAGPGDAVPAAGPGAEARPVMFDAEKMKGRDLSFDVYDLAALAYIYKRIKEIDPIREATHVVIDEAQDFGMMAYHCLDYCLRGCTYTIMGDTSQNIHFQYGLNDWNELRELALPNPYDSFLLLKKSYRNTVEISEFATEILRHGDFSIYPVQPILRHGEAVNVSYCKGKASLTKKTIRVVKDWQEKGYETIAIICRDEEEAAAVSKNLSQYLEIRNPDLTAAEFGNGVMVLSVAYTKGLEFDAVLVYDPSEEKYPADNGHVKMLYVTATRALHELCVVHGENLTPLIGEKAPEDKHMEEFADQSSEEKIVRPPKMTEREIIEERRRAGRLEMEAREKMGPKRVAALKPGEKVDTEIKIRSYRSRNLEAYEKYKEQKAAEEKELTLNEKIMQILARREQEEKERQTAYEQEHVWKMKKSSQTLNQSGVTAKKLAERMQDKAARPVNTSNHLFGEMPDDKDLEVKGHSRGNHAVRWAKKTKTGLEVTSSYGVLTVTPVNEECIRITFRRGVGGNGAGASGADSKGAGLNGSGYWDFGPGPGLHWTAKESPKALEVATKKVIVHIEKKDGAVRFLTPERKILLVEKLSEPRLIESEETWTFFEQDKKEKTKAKGLLGTDLREVSLKSRYISFGAKKIRMPLLLSNKGYAIGVAAERTVMYCDVPMYGRYIYTDGTDCIDYYFMYGGNNERNLKLYAGLEGR